MIIEFLGYKHLRRLVFLQFFQQTQHKIYYNHSFSSSRAFYYVLHLSSLSKASRSLNPYYLVKLIKVDCKSDKFEFISRLKQLAHETRDRVLPRLAFENRLTSIWQ